MSANVFLVLISPISAVNIKISALSAIPAPISIDIIGLISYRAPKTQYDIAYILEYADIWNHEFLHPCSLWVQSPSSAETHLKSPILEVNNMTWHFYEYAAHTVFHIYELLALLYAECAIIFICHIILFVTLLYIGSASFFCDFLVCFRTVASEIYSLLHK